MYRYIYIYIYIFIGCQYIPGMYVYIYRERDSGKVTFFWNGHKSSWFTVLTEWWFSIVDFPPNMKHPYCVVPIIWKSRTEACFLRACWILEGRVAEHIRYNQWSMIVDIYVCIYIHIHTCMYLYFLGGYGAIPMNSFLGGW